jgi:hypothetical protein
VICVSVTSEARFVFFSYFSNTFVLRLLLLRRNILSRTDISLLEDVEEFTRFFFGIGGWGHFLFFVGAIAFQKR